MNRKLIDWHGIGLSLYVTALTAILTGCPPFVAVDEDGGLSFGLVI